MATVETSKIQILQCNTNGNPGRLVELRDLVKESFSQSILVLNDVRVKEAHDMNIPSHDFLVQAKVINPRYAGGCAIGFPKGWRASRIPTEFEETILCICSSPEGYLLKIMTTYIHGRRKIFERKLMKQFADISHNGQTLPGFITGDLNSAHTAFGSSVDTAAGTALISLMSQFNLYVVHGASPTYISNSTASCNLLDFTIANQAGALSVDSWEVLPNVGSDHLPTLTTLNLTTKLRAVTYDKVNWDLFKNNLLAFSFSKESFYYNITEIDKAVDKLTELICEAKHSATTKESRRTNGRTILSKETVKEINKRRKLGKLRKKINLNPNARIQIRCDFNSCCRKVRRLIERDGRLFEERLACRIAREKDPGKRWKMVEEITNFKDKSQKPISFLKDKQGILKGNKKDIVNIHADRLKDTHTVNTGDSFDQEFREVVEGFLEDNDDIFTPLPPEYINRVEEGDDTFNQLRISVENLKGKICSLDNNSAPGDDKITNLMLKNLPQNIHLLLCNILNSSLQIGYFPRAWKRAKVKMLLKPGKDATESHSYRPISLLSVLGKLFERFLKDWTEKILMASEYFNQYQSGFKKKRCAQENFVRLTEEIYTAFKQRECLVGVFLDIDKAFDKIWLEGLKYKLFQSKLPIKMVRILSSFLSERSLFVSEDGSDSEPIDLKAGSPQGSILSPLLFSIFANDIPFEKMGCHASQYADDIGLWCRKRGPKLADTVLQGGLDLIQKWCSKWRIKLSPGKSQVITFTRRPTLLLMSPRLKLFGKILPLANKNQVKFLGITLDRRLTWSPYIDSLIQKCHYRIHAINKIACRVKNGDYSTVFDLFRSLVTSIFSFGAPAFVAMTGTNWKKINLIQMKAVKRFLKLPSSISRKIALDASGETKLDLQIKSQSLKRLRNIIRDSPPAHNSILLSPRILDNTYISPVDALLIDQSVSLENRCALCIFSIPHDCVPRAPN